MRLSACVIATLLAASCASTQLRTTPVPPSQFAAVVRAWNTVGMPDASQCAAPRVVVTSGDQFVQLCQQQACGEPRVPPCADSCFEYHAGYVVLSPGHTAQGWIDHETLHSLQSCSGLPMDHADPRIWGAGGVLQTLGG